MAIQSFYFSIQIDEEDKNIILSKAGVKKQKKENDLIYKDVLFIDNITTDESWWHINAGLYDFFHSCEILYEFCQMIESIKPKFLFCFLGEKYEFSFQSLLDFVSFVYPKVEKYKKNFEKCHGTLSIHPNKFFRFKRKNYRFFK